MKSFTYIIQDENGIHARPAGLMVKEVKAMSSHAVINCKGRSADMSKLFAVMGLAVKKGDEIQVTVEGDREGQDAEALEAFVRANF